MIQRIRHYFKKRRVIKGCLAWCNERREERGMEPLPRLPKGKKSDSRSCPCGAATGLIVYGITAWNPEDPMVGEISTTPEVADFVHMFDDGLIPEYDIEAA